MLAKPGLSPAWRRLRRVADFARGSASGGAVPILIRRARTAALCRGILADVNTTAGFTRTALITDDWQLMLALPAALAVV